MLQGTEDALKLNGSDMGGCNLEVHDAQERDEYYINREASGGPFIDYRRRRLLLNRHKFTRYINLFLMIDSGLLITIVTCH